MDPAFGLPVLDDCEDQHYNEQYTGQCRSITHPEKFKTRLVYIHYERIGCIRWTTIGKYRG
jgi:hypothetical protein